MDVLKLDELTEPGTYWVRWSDGKMYSCTFDGKKVKYPFDRKRGKPISFTPMSDEITVLPDKRKSLFSN